MKKLSRILADDYLNSCQIRGSYENLIGINGGFMDSYTKVETVGIGNRIGSAIAGVFIGILLFFGSFFVLFWNEGRVNLAKVAEAAAILAPTGSPTAAPGNLVSVTGILSAAQPLGDGQFLKPGNYVALDRKAEMYAWEEDETTETRKNVGGSETRVTTYSYSKEWTEDPEDSQSFEKSAEHYNPPKSIPSQVFKANGVKIGQYNLEMDNPALKIETPTPVTLTSGMLLPNSRAILSGQYFYQGTGSLSNPNIGDIRMSYTSLNTGVEGTIFGSFQSDRIVPYPAPRNISFYRLYAGSREAGIQKMAIEHSTLTWILRVVGFLMMWIGSMMVFEPLSTILDILPFLGSASRWLTSGATFVACLLLSGITILFGIIAFNPFLLIPCVGIVFFLMIRFLRKRRFATEQR
jgi:hypothetical protein